MHDDVDWKNWTDETPEEDVVRVKEDMKSFDL